MDGQWARYIRHTQDDGGEVQAAHRSGQGRRGGGGTGSEAENDNLAQTINKIVLTWNVLQAQLEENDEAFDKIIELLGYATKEKDKLFLELGSRNTDLATLANAHAQTLHELANATSGNATLFGEAQRAIQQSKEIGKLIGLGSEQSDAHTSAIKKCVSKLEELITQMSTVTKEQKKRLLIAKKAVRERDDEIPENGERVPRKARTEIVPLEMAGNFTELFGAKPGRKAGEIPGSSVTPMTLYRYMQQQWKAYNKKSDKAPPSSFAPGDIGYIPYQVLTNEEMHTGGWVRKHLLENAEKKQPYVGETEEFVGCGKKFGADEVATFNEAARRRGMDTLKKLVKTSREQKKAHIVERKLHGKLEGAIRKAFVDN